VDPLKVFIDTEFTDFFEPKLISLGMVAATGEECYVEMPFPDNECSDFVRESVVPLLASSTEAYCARSTSRIRLLSWLEIVRNTGQSVEICFDYQTDWDLFAEALDGTVPSWISARNVNREVNELMLYDFWRRAKVNGSDDREHHALSDARALAYAFRERPR
jgi:hypothetical protein